MQEENEINKTFFFKELIKSIKDFDKYEDFAIEGIGKSLKYFVKILLTFCVIICIAYTYKIMKNTQNVYSSLKDKIPEFAYEKGELITENTEPIIIEDYGETVGSIIIDTKTESDNIINDYKEQIDKFGSGILLLKNKFIVVNPNLNGRAEYKYSELLSVYNIQNANREQLVNYIDSINIVYVILTVFFVLLIGLFIAFFITTILDVLMLSCLGYVSSRFFRLKIKFSVAFSVAVHAITFPILLNLVYILINLFSGFEIKYFQIMYYTIAYIYVIVAVLMIKTDFINRQAELIKIAQEQMKIKEELEEQEEEKKEQENNKEKKQKDEDKETNSNQPKEKSEKEDEPVKPMDPKKKKEKAPDNPIGDASSTIHESE